MLNLNLDSMTLKPKQVRHINPFNKLKKAISAELEDLKNLYEEDLDACLGKPIDEIRGDLKVMGLDSSSAQAEVREKLRELKENLLQENDSKVKDPTSSARTIHANP